MDNWRAPDRETGEPTEETDPTDSVGDADPVGGDVTEADPADVAEQIREVPTDDEEHER